MNKPMTYAHATFIEGDQGGGKSVTAVAREVDKTFANITSVKVLDGRVFKATPTNPPQIGKATIWLPDRKPFVAKLPKHSCAIADSVKIYANFHFYGIRACYMTLDMIIEFLNDGTITDGDVICDEHYIGGNSHRRMSNLVGTIEQLGFQMRKRHINYTMIAPYRSLVGSGGRVIVTEHIMCTYDEKKCEVTLTIKKKGERKFRTLPPYWEPQYRPYYNTDELISLPQDQIGKAIIGAR